MQRVGGRRARMLACTCVAALALVSCGQDSDPTAEEPTQEQPTSESPSSESPSSEPSSSPSDEPVPPGTPDCSEVWQAGGPIPRSYQGCADEAGAYVERDAVGCSSGQRMVRYADRFWGVLGGTVNEAQGPLDKDRDYRSSMRNCSA